ncbi:MAG: sodium/proline symporter PutP [Clostridia bacterium]|nr:sodium/proline symporter PutP [Clostridia bacterium]
MDSQKIQILISMLIYMVAMVAIGIIFYYKTKDSSDYFLGGRRLGPWVGAISAEASDMSGWLLMGLPGLAYATGFGEAAWTAIGLAAGTYLNWKFVAERLRKYTQLANDSITLPDFFSNRFHDKSKILMSISALFILIFFTLYTATGFVASGKLFNSIFGLDYIPMMILSALIIVAYTATGGFLAASTTDLVQGILMFFSLIVVLMAGTIAAGGVGAVGANLSGLNGYMDWFAVMDPVKKSAVPFGAISIISALAWGVGYFGMPHILVRFMAIKTTQEIKRSRVIAMIWVIISLIAAVIIGVVGRAYLGDTLVGGDSEKVFIYLSTNLIPSLIAGVILSGILAATMSTADSQLLVTSSAISTNFYKGLIRKNASEKEMMWVGRLTVITVAIVAAFIARDPNSSIFSLVKYAWAGFGATFGPVILFSLFWKRTTRNGALAGMLCGGVLVILWKEVVSKLGGIFAMYEMVPAFLFSTLAIIVVSLLDKEPSKEIQQEFDSIKDAKI